MTPILKIVVFILAFASCGQGALSSVLGAQLANGTIPSTSFEAVHWLRSQLNTVKFDDAGRVNEVVLDYIPLNFVVGDLDVFEHLRTLHVNVTDDFLDGHMTGIARLRTLRKIKFHSCESISSASLSVLHFLPELEVLELIDCGGVGSLLPLRSCRNLREINLGNSEEFDFRELTSLAEVTSLRKLILDDNYLLDDEHLKGLARLPNLTHLHLDNCSEITDEGVIAIAKRKRLVELSLGNNGGITGACFQSLADCPLEKLNLNFCRNIAAVVGDLREIVSLRELSLNGTPGISTDKLRFLEQLVDLEVLRLQGLEIGDEGLKGIHSRKLRVLDLGHCSGVSVDALSRLPAANFLEELSLVGNRTLSPSRIRLLAERCPNLQRFNVSGTRLKSDACDEISQFRSLKFLDVSGCKFIDDDAVERLCRCKSLEALDLSRDWRITDRSLEHLAGLPVLKRLAISDAKQLTGMGFAKFTQASCLEHLDLANVQNLTLEGVRQLKGLENLKSLTISDTRLSDQHIHELFGIRASAVSLVGSLDEVDPRLFSAFLRSVMK